MLMFFAIRRFISLYDFRYFHYVVRLCASAAYGALRRSRYMRVVEPRYGAPLLRHRR